MTCFFWYDRMLPLPPSILTYLMIKKRNCVGTEIGGDWNLSLNAYAKVTWILDDLEGAKAHAEG